MTELGRSQKRNQPTTSTLSQMDLVCSATPSLKANFCEISRDRVGRQTEYQLQRLTKIFLMECLSAFPLWKALTSDVEYE